MADDEQGTPAPAGLRKLFREFWFQVGVAVTATVIASLAIAVIPHLSDSGSEGQKAASSTVVIQNAAENQSTSTTTAAGTATTGAPGTATTAAGQPLASSTVAPPTSAAKAAASAAAATTQPPATAPAATQPPATAPAATQPPSGKVPDVHAATLNNAAVALKAVGFNDIPFVNGCFGGAPGTVTSQSPAAGQVVALSTPIRLQVEATNCAVIPNVLGQQLQPAADKINGAGFHNIPFRYECLGSPNIGAVITQSPDGGVDTATDTPVTLRLQDSHCP